jgi:hypothetical protein
MKTILYNTQTQEIKHHAKKGYYKVRGKKAIDFPELLPQGWKELIWDDTVPTVTETQVLEAAPAYADLTNKTYKPVTYTVRSKTPEEIALEGFGYTEYAMRLDIHPGVLFTLKGLAYRIWLQDKGYPVEMQADESYRVWVDSISPQHQNYISQLENAGDLTITQRPTTN